MWWKSADLALWPARDVVALIHRYGSLMVSLLVKLFVCRKNVVSLVNFRLAEAALATPATQTLQEVHSTLRIR